ncbi:MAG: imidazoleglycerol-phosphate dehydratase, partial [Aestuariivita sp.]|nr:imidazoleglycerol-phosphate dehydratase [Aestuariivita sp.]
MRQAKVNRKTSETEISVAIDLDGTGQFDNKTGIGFFNHMLDQLSRHSSIDISMYAQGDNHID